MTEKDIALLAAEYAKEITVAAIPDKSVSMVASSGGGTSEFFRELYKGIFETLKADLAEK